MEQKRAEDSAQCAAGLAQSAECLWFAVRSLAVAVVVLVVVR